MPGESSNFIITYSMRSALANNDYSMEIAIIVQNGWKNEGFNKADSGAYFQDKVRKIDMVLAYEDSDEEESDSEELFSTVTNISKGSFNVDNTEAAEENKRMARKTFEKNLQMAGLQLEHESRTVSM